VSSASGRKCAIATNPDRCRPTRPLQPNYRDKDKSKKAPLGMHARFIGFLIKRYAGNLDFFGSCPVDYASSCSTSKRRATWQPARA
jgi:hypothetical protein